MSDAAIGRREDAAERSREALMDGMRSLVEKERQLARMRLKEKEAELDSLKRHYETIIREQMQETHADRIRAASSGAGDEHASAVGGAEAVDHFELAPPLAALLGLDGAFRKSKGRPPQARQFVHLTSVNLCGQGLQDAQLDRLASLLLWLPAVRALDVSHNALTDGSAPAFGKVLVGDPGRRESLAVERLDASGNALGSAFLAVLCAALPDNRVLKQLRVHDNPFGHGNGSGQALAKAVAASPSLEALSATLGQPLALPGGAASAGAKRAAKGAARRAAPPGRTNDVLFAQALPKTRLRALSLCGAALAPAAVPLLAKSLATIQFLDLTGAMLGHQGVCELAEALGAGASSSRRPGGQPRPASPASKRGRRRAASPHSRGGRASGPGVVSLVLRTNDIGSAAARALFASVPACHTLTHLDVSSNRIGPEALPAVADCLRSAPHLARLELGGNAFSGADASPVVDAVREAGTLVSVGAAPGFGGAASASMRAAVCQNRIAQRVRGARARARARALRGDPLAGCIVARIEGDPGLRGGGGEGDPAADGLPAAPLCPEGEEGLAPGAYALQVAAPETAGTESAPTPVELPLAAWAEATAAPLASVRTGRASWSSLVLASVDAAPSCAECAATCAGDHVLCWEARVVAQRAGASSGGADGGADAVEVVRRFLWQVRVAAGARRCGTSAHGTVLSAAGLGQEGTAGALRTALPWGSLPAGVRPDVEQIAALRDEAARASDTRHPLWAGTTSGPRPDRGAVGLVAAGGATDEARAAVAQAPGRLARTGPAAGGVDVEDVLLRGRGAGAGSGGPFVRILVPIGRLEAGDPVAVHIMGGSAAAGDRVEVRHLELWRLLRSDEDAAVTERAARLAEQGERDDASDPQGEGGAVEAALRRAEDAEDALGAVAAVSLWGGMPFDAEACGVGWDPEL